MIFAKSRPETALRQGELLSNVLQLVTDLHTISHETPHYHNITHAFAYVLSQDCDLDWDYNSRMNPESRDRTIPSILLCEARPATSAASHILKIEGSKNTNRSRIWPRIMQNKDERYQFFSKVECSFDLQAQGIKELVIDFKRYFTVPTGEVYKRIQNGETLRRCRLESPYLEHLSSRFAYFLSHVALPEDYESVPGIVRRSDT